MRKFLLRSSVNSARGKDPVPVAQRRRWKAQGAAIIRWESCMKDKKRTSNWCILGFLRCYSRWLWIYTVLLGRAVWRPCKPAIYLLAFHTYILDEWAMPDYWIFYWWKLRISLQLFTIYIILYIYICIGWGTCHIRAFLFRQGNCSYSGLYP